MRKHIKPFLPKIYTIKEDSYIDLENDTYKQNKEEVLLNKDKLKQIKNTHKDLFVKNIELNLKHALEMYWKTKKENENIILEAKERLDMNFKNMLNEFENAIQKMDKLGIDIKNNEVELEELTLVLRIEEKMYELTDKDKIELYDIFVSLNKAHADACKDLAKSMNAISEVIKYTEFGVYYKKPEGSKRHKEAYFRSEITIPVKESNRMNESFVSNIFDFFKSVGEKIKNYVFSIETNLDVFDDLMLRAKNIVKS